MSELSGLGVLRPVPAQQRSTKANSWHEEDQYGGLGQANLDDPGEDWSAFVMLTADL
jgi:hypothetical protein